VRSLFIQISVLIGILTLADRLAGDWSVIESVLVALGSATAMYLVLTFGDLAVQRIMDRVAPGKPEVPETEASRKEATAPSLETPGALAA
jgi:hypothetical protein